MYRECSCCGEFFYTKDRFEIFFCPECEQDLFNDFNNKKMKVEEEIEESIQNEVGNYVH